MSESEVNKVEDSGDLLETSICEIPWVENMLKRVETKVKIAVLYWCKVMKRIGEEPEPKIEIYEKRLDELLDDLNVDIDGYAEKIVDKLEKKLSTLADICKDLKMALPSQDFYGPDVPLVKLHEMLSKQLQEHQEILDNRRDEINKLNKKMEELCIELGRPIKLLPISPIPSKSDIETQKTLIDTIEIMKYERIERFFDLKEKILELINEMGYESELDFEKLVFSTNTPLISDQESQYLEDFYIKLKMKSKNIKEEIDTLRTKIDGLWDKLETDFLERNQFLTQIDQTKSTIKILKLLQDEVKRCDLLKRENIKKWIDKQKEELISWWEKCNCTDDERQEFGFFNSDCYTEDLFELYEREITRWEFYYKKNEEIFTQLKQFKKLWQELLDMEIKPQGGIERYKNRGGQLLMEEKKRNKLMKKLPKLEESLLNLAKQYYEENQKEFRSFGETIPDIITKLHEERNKEFKERLSEKKQRDQSGVTHITGNAAACKTLFPSTSATPSTSHFLTPSHHTTNSVLKKTTTTPFNSATKSFKRKIITTPASSSITKKIKIANTPSKTATKIITPASSKTTTTTTTTVLKENLPGRINSTKTTTTKTPITTTTIKAPTTITSASSVPKKNALPTLNVIKAKRRSREMRDRVRQRKKSRSLTSNQSMTSEEYEKFKNELSQRNDIRSTGYVLRELQVPLVVVTEHNAKSPYLKKK